MNGNKEHWIEAREFFVHGSLDANGKLVFPSLLTVSKTFTMFTYEYIRSVAKKNNWEGLREVYKLSFEKKSIEARDNELINQAVNFQKECSDIANRGLAHLKTAFDEAEKMVKTNEKDGKLGLKDLEILAKAAEKFQKVGCVAHGTPDSNKTLSGPGQSPIKVLFLDD
jgi:hypothetical protein